jgi:HK97 family phage major capsid protein
MAIELDPKEVVTELNKAFNEFKAENAKGRAADKEVLAKVNADLDRLDKKNSELAAAKEATENALAEVEKKFNRIQLGKPGEAPADERKTAFERWAREGDQRLGAELHAMRERKALITGDDTAGGYLAPPDYVLEIIKAEVLASPVRSFVKVRSTGRSSVQLPKRTSPAAAVWVSEIATRTETTNPAFGLVEVQTHEMTAEVYVSMAELEDSVFDLEAFLTAEFGEQFGVTEGLAVIAGNGVGKPLGIVDATGPVVAGGYFTPSGGTTTIQDATGQGNGLVTLMHAVKTPYASKGKWLLNRTTLGSVRKLQDTQKRYLWEPSLQAGVPSQILGAPYVECVDMPNEGANTYPIAFGDFMRGYTLVDRLSIAVVRDPYTKASVGQVKFVARRRIGGQVVLAEAIRLLKCA